MPPTIAELEAQRDALIAASEQIVADADEAEREVTGEELATVEAHHAVS